MRISLFIVFTLSVFITLTQTGCISSTLRFPSSHDEIYKFSDLKQNLLLAAQNNILFHIPQDTLFEVEKTTVDSKCHDDQKPFWSEKLSIYLNLMRSHPEWFTKFHVIEIKKGDAPKVTLEKDLDNATILSIQYGKSESRGKVSLKTNLPCPSQRVAEFIGKDIIKTQFDFPASTEINRILAEAPERKHVQRFHFSNEFISYLAERGFILKFTHELSFERNSQNKFVMSEILNKLGQEVSQKKNDTKYVHLWMKILNDISKSDNIVQLFALENQAALKTGIKFTTDSEVGAGDLKSFSAQLYLTYNVDNEVIQSSQISDLENCLARISNQKTNTFMRQPASDVFAEGRNLKEYSCQGSASNNILAPVQSVQHN